MLLETIWHVNCTAKTVFFAEHGNPFWHTVVWISLPSLQEGLHHSWKRSAWQMTLFTWFVFVSVYLSLNMWFRGYVLRRKAFYHLCLDYCVYLVCFSRPVYVFFAVVLSLVFLGSLPASKASDAKQSCTLRVFEWHFWRPSRRHRGNQLKVYTCHGSKSKLSSLKTSRTLPAALWNLSARSIVLY